MDSPYKIGDWTVYPESNRLVKDADVCVVEPRVLGLLNCFAARPGAVLDRDFLIECAWDGVIVSESTINHTIGVLRRTLGDNARSPRYIETVAKKGYRLLLEPEKLPEGARVKLPSEGTRKEAAKSPVLRWGLSAAALIGALLIGRILVPAEEEMGPLFTSLKPITTEAGRELGPATDPKGQYVYFSYIAEGSEQADLYRQPVRGGAMEPVFGNTETVSEFSPTLSADGKHIAYSRFEDGSCEVMIAALDGSGSENLLGSCGRYGAQLNWSPTGDVYFANATLPRAPQKIFKVSPTDGQITEITEGKTGIGDYTYALSRDGSKLAYMRTTHWNHSDLRVKDLNTGEDELIYQFATWFFDLAFDAAGENLFFTADPNRHTLERINIKSHKRETVFRQEKSIGDFTALPAGGGLIATQANWDMNIYSTTAKGESVRSLGSLGDKLVYSTRADWQPRLSPDGETLAFLSDRTGQLEIWVSDRAGRNARQISHLDGALRVHVFDWSPDGKSFVFDASGDRIYVINAETGALKPVTAEGLMARNPAFSPDGRSVVYTSDVTGTWQIWQQDIVGGTPKQITTGGGFSARFGTDGTLNFTKYYRDGLWQMDAETGVEKLVVPKMVSGPVQQWELTDDGVYYINIEKSPTRVMFSAWADATPRALFDVPFLGLTFELDPKDGSFLFSREDNRTSDIVLVR